MGIAQLKLATVVIAASIIFTTIAFAQAEQHPPALITIDASDFITVLKWAFAFGGFLLAALAAIGVAFFGFDVRSARSQIDKEMVELRNITKEAKALVDQIK